MRLLALFPIMIEGLASGLAGPTQFSEALELTQFPDGKVLAEFEFQTKLDWAAFAGKLDLGHHYDLLPRQMGEIIQVFGVDELHLSFTQGRWRSDRWGYNKNVAPSGAHLVTWLSPQSRSESDQYEGLINALAGLFCSSLNFMDKSITTSPRYVFSPADQALVSKGLFDQSVLKYSHLPRETVCTENLTPWAKLLPCHQKVFLCI
ncbi:hypothetical protein HDU91_005691 [Kappamyces sp. JEL0680]|nr:hypothetical protein HDU91_005691 [Kappamyces sp. JEL0680]